MSSVRVSNQESNIWKAIRVRQSPIHQVFFPPKLSGCDIISMIFRCFLSRICQCIDKAKLLCKYHFQEFNLNRLGSHPRSRNSIWISWDVDSQSVVAICCPGSESVFRTMATTQKIDVIVCCLARQAMPGAIDIPSWPSNWWPVPQGGAADDLIIEILGIHERSFHLCCWVDKGGND